MHLRLAGLTESYLLNIHTASPVPGVSHHASGCPEKLAELVVPVAVGSVAAEPAANQSPSVSAVL